METLEKIKTATAMKEKAEELLNSALDDAFNVYKRWDMAVNNRVWFQRWDLDSVTIDEGDVTFCFYKSYSGGYGRDAELVTFSEKFFTDFDTALIEYKNT